MNFHCPFTNTTVIEAGQPVQFNVGIRGFSHHSGYDAWLSDFSVYEEDTPKVAGIPTKPSQLAKVIPNAGRINGGRLDFDGSEILSHAARYVHEKVGLRSRIGSILEMRVACLVDLAT